MWLNIKSWTRLPSPWEQAHPPILGSSRTPNLMPIPSESLLVEYLPHSNSHHIKQLQLFQMTSSPITLPFTHSGWDSLPSLLFLKHTRHTSTLRNLHLLVLFPGMFFPQISTGLTVLPLLDFAQKFPSPGLSLTPCLKLKPHFLKLFKMELPYDPEFPLLGIYIQRKWNYYLLKNAYWSIVDSQCCVSFRCTAKWISYICVCVCVCVYIYIC